MWKTISKFCRRYILLTKIYDRYGLSRETVLFRSIYLAIAAMTSLSLCHVAGFYLFQFTETKPLWAMQLLIQWGELVTTQWWTACLVGVATFWAIHRTLSREYDAKYLRLAKIIDDILPRAALRDEKGLLPRRARMYIEAEYLGFAEYCLLYRMHRHRSFCGIFRNTFAVLLKLKEDKENYAKLILREHEVVSEYLGKVTQNQALELDKVYNQLLNIDLAWEMIDRTEPAHTKPNGKPQVKLR